MDLKGKKIVIYFYPNYACVVDTVKTKDGYKETNKNKAHCTNPEKLINAIKKVYDWGEHYDKETET